VHDCTSYPIAVRSEKWAENENKCPEVMAQK
jgi:hypothetical protein